MDLASSLRINITMFVAATSALIRFGYLLLDQMRESLPKMKIFRNAFKQ